MVCIHALCFSEFAQFEEEATILKQELESTEGKKIAQAKALEKSNRLLKQEKEDLQKVNIHLMLKQ